MTDSSRKLIGMFGLIIYLTVYCLVVVGFAAGPVTELNILLQTIFYLLAGLVWLPPARWLLYWMNGAQKQEDAS